ncbi:4'-phosphopantetheinyl transferase family protein [Elstera litoralis]|uniref:4'-phosphopantetheinyl transferase family protein n=1 Tax=Elstera litoralis TaxID=552518 RepID=UPI000696E547|nr:4'-phosphopantetheinyl transferase superfamily protein [Elstera litoralis]
MTEGEWLADIKAECRAILAQGRALVVIVPTALTPPPGQGLTEAEQARAARYGFQADHRAFTLGHMLTRGLLLEDGQIEDFALGPYGKPFLPNAPGFNLAHSGGFLTLVVGNSPWLGIDIETGPRDGKYRDLLIPVCHPAERAYLAGRGLDAFLKCWTRKEALLKARGTGLSDDLTQIDTRLGETMPFFSGEPSLVVFDLPLKTAGPPLVGAVALPPGLGVPLYRIYGAD